MTKAILDYLGKAGMEIAASYGTRKDLSGTLSVTSSTPPSPSRFRPQFTIHNLPFTIPI